MPAMGVHPTIRGVCALSRRAQSHSSQYAALLIRFHAIGVASATSLDEFRADADRSHVTGQLDWKIRLNLYSSSMDQAKR